jgi:predicted DNA-binding transcriptional regulator AlpA
MLLEEVIIALDRDEQQAHLTLRWRGGFLSELDVALWHVQTPSIRTDEDTIDLLRRLAVHYPDAVIAGVLNRQGRRTATGLRFTTNRVCSLRTHWSIPRFEPPVRSPAGDLVNIRQAARIIGIAASTLHRWINDGFIAGEQITPGAPWRIRLSGELRARFVDNAPDGYVPMIDATRLLGLSRQTVLQRVKRGELDAVHVCRGRRKGLRIKVPRALPTLFPAQPTDGV